MFAHSVELTVHRDRLTITDAKSGSMVDRRAVEPFSCEHLVVARPDRLAALLREIIVELHGKRRFLMFPHLRIGAGSDLLHEIEIAALRKIAEDAGFRNVAFDEQRCACRD